MVGLHIGRGAFMGILSRLHCEILKLVFLHSSPSARTINLLRKRLKTLWRRVKPKTQYHCMWKCCRSRRKANITLNLSKPNTKAFKCPWNMMSMLICDEINYKYIIHYETIMDGQTIACFAGTKHTRHIYCKFLLLWKIEPTPRPDLWHCLLFFFCLPSTLFQAS